MTRSTRLLAACALLALTGVVPLAHAEVPGVSALIQQGRYWQGKGRQDLAAQAFRRALALDPDNAQARQGLAGPAPRAPAMPTPAPKAQPRREEPAPATAPSASASATPAVRSTPQRANTTGGASRAAGFKALEANDLDGAERAFERAVQSNRRDADALGGLGLVRLRQARFGEARDLLDEASRSGSPSQWAEALASARFFAGLADARAALAQGRLGEAQAQVEGLIRSGYPQRGPALEVLADIYERQGRYADAADLYRQANEGAKQSDGRLASRAARDRALAAAARGDDVTAEQEFHSGLLLDQRDPWIRYEFARYLTARRRLPEAESLMNSLGSSNDPDWLYAAALLNADMGRASAADALMARVPEMQRTAQMRHFAVGLKVDGAIERAKALAAQGRQGEALGALRQLAATPGISADKQAAIADALYELGDTAGAAQLAQQALSGDISDPQGYEPIVRVLAKTGHDAFATNAIQRAAQLAGNSTDGQRVIARMNGIMAAAQADRLRTAGQYAAAFDLLQGAWNAAPGNQDVLAALARLYQSGGMPAQAAQTYQMLLAQSPDDRGALMGLIETAGAAGDRELARRTIDRALQVAPDDYEIYLAAARMEQARGDESAALRYLKRAKEVYAAKSGAATLSASNPFAATMQGNNPFRNQAAAPVQPPANPFALGSGARLAGAAPVPAGAAFAPFQSVTDTGGFAPAVVAQSAPVGGGFGSPALPASVAAPAPSAPGVVSGDPVMARIQSEIQTLTRESGPRAELRTGYRERSGETGLSGLKELTGTAEISTGLGGGRIKAKAEAVVLDSGRPTGSALARFGRNATPEAQGIVAEQPSQLVNAQTQHASGVALSAAYETPLLQLELGTTPLGFEDNEVTWRAAISPRLSPYATARVWAERKPVTDSVLSYAGTRDPVTGAFWGQVMRTGGGVSFSYDQDGAGIYGDLSYYRYAGTDVRKNHGLQANVGGYLPFYRGDRSSIVGGINVNYQDFDNNQNYFTYGHGGYFSPQSFFSISLPVRYSYASDLLEVKAGVAPGYQSYNQDQVSIYPTDPAAQAVLDGLKAQNSDVRSYYDSLSKTGFALSADGSIYYRVSPSTRVGGEIGINTFGSYDEFKSLVGIKQSLGGSR
ncbi:cellulose synthase subunit BcsC-related outer membrane protein [Sphingobium sp. AP49]|uniref:cellulose biosynthesis protein BcsC n=1 Tax=Sphingobium sp. AP49 TaxID=1144307 RepID=UPI00026ED8DD|nr:cellulose biosynthesis protein BcsC [Sphingobium sp. AP49]WHO37288.1 cellulose synthase subunit BcsC-related outer membrane protein [Sphingobium sp. AP49]